MTTNPATQARRATAIEGWITPPRNTHHGRASEGHTSAVNVLRLVNTRHQHQAAEPVPFHSRPAPLRSIKPAATKARGCAGAGSACHGHPDCADRHCEGHPDNCGDDGRYFESRAAAVFWRWYIGCVVAVVCLVVYFFTR